MEKTFALVALCIVVFSVSVYADGMIIPEPMPPHPHPTYLEVKYHHVNVTIDNQFTETDIDQVFHNPNYWDIEGTYLFPLPEGASIQKFSMYVDGKELQGEVLDADEARHTYEDLVRKMIDPGLLEYVDRNTFKARVYPIAANGDKRVRLDYSEVISCESGICEYTYPLNTEKFSSKNLESVVINTKIKSNVAIKNVYSPSHKIDVKRLSDYEVQVSYEASDVKPDTDFKLIYTLSEDDIGLNLITHKEGDTGYFLLMMAPKFSVAASQVMPKDIVFVLDKSGSMAGEKIERAKDALKFCLNNLNSGDRFGIVTFSTGVSSYKESLDDASSGTVSGAVDFVDDIEALGGTDIESALLEAMDMLPEDARPKMVVFLTDGEPTVGVTDINQIIGDVSGQNTADARIFVFGIGYDVNTRLLDKLSFDNHGVADYVVEDENIEVKVSNFYEKVDSPVLSDVSLEISEPCGLGTSEMYPKQLPDIFKGTQVLVFGQYDYMGVLNCEFATGDNGPSAEITLKGKVNGVEQSITYSREFPFEDSGNDFLPRLWATRKIGYLLETIRLEGESDELVDEIVKLAKKYGIATPYTSFLILEDEPTGREGLRNALAPTSGFQGVSASQDIGGYKATESAGAASQNITSDGQTTAIKYVGSKTFIERNGILTDTDYIEGSATKNLKYGSDAYFNALAANPGLGQYFAIGKNVIVCVGGACIKVGENYAGAEDTISLDLGAGLPMQCDTDSDCRLTCACGCVGINGPDVICESQMDCPTEVGITGCRCSGGVCVPVRDPNWQLPGQPPSLPGCGNGICESGESSSSCPADCVIQPGGGTGETKRTGEDKTGTLLILGGLVVILVIGLMVVRMGIGKKSDSKKDKKK